MKKIRKKNKLNKDKIAQLSDADLSEINGGIIIPIPKDTVKEETDEDNETNKFNFLSTLHIIKGEPNTEISQETHTTRNRANNIRRRRV